MDAIDDKILRALEADGRISNLQLAERVGLSPSACLRRVQCLESEGIIVGYRAILDRTKLGAGLVIFVTVGLSGQLKRDSQAFEQAMMNAPEVRECHNVTGSVEYLLRVEVADLAAYKTFHSDTLGTLPQVSSITSHVCLASSKDLRA
ncbi:Lrp/AsnC family transcriptional regulator [Sphingorhabdus contaminans]|uniref:Lrp/AsnC family transcriptional regulator n=1 Tax=Sphingorhabdus contaminans TaxID=1343899 RepID=A0A553WD20_9SPHN|nr:Lrp/AsnC family transcriptional regulator [Sphingorhabdus contaminans]TSB02590.1 Lrp/AsnC family transcriptional regulator [Sphingorhabdus contaminans]